jgi:hypothetical protein
VENKRGLVERRSKPVLLGRERDGLDIVLLVMDMEPQITRWINFGQFRRGIR